MVERAQSEMKLKVKVIQLCPALCDPMEYTVHAILQARIPEWLAWPFSRGSSRPRNRTGISYITGRFFYQLSYEGSPEIVKGVHQSCILSPCLFNLYSEYIMLNARLDESQAGIKVAGRISITSDMQMIQL